MAGMVRFSALMPRRAMESLGKVLKGDQVLAHPDHTARAAYEARMTQTIEGAKAEPAPAAVAPAAKAVEPAAEPPAETVTAGNGSTEARGNGAPEATGNGATDAEPAPQAETV
jgi:hypothetical protein